MKTDEIRHRRTGRPPANDYDRYFWESALHKLLAERLGDIPGVVHGGRVRPKSLAKLLKKADYTVYRWLNESRLSTSGVRAILELSGDRIKKEELLPFLSI